MRRLLISIAIALAAASCASETVDTTTGPPLSTTGTPTTVTTAGVAPTTTTAPLPEVQSAVFFFFEGYPVAPGPYLVAVARTGVNDLTGLLTALLEGTTEDEALMGLSSTIPQGTRLLGVEVSDGVAFIDVSREFESGGGSLSMMGRVAQIVYTATRFEDVDAVRFLLEGVPLDVLGGEGLMIDRPQTRDDWVDLTPPIMIEAPAWGSAVGKVIDLSGTADVDTGMVSFVIVDSEGLIIHEGELVSTPGERSRFDTDLELEEVPYPGLGSIIVWEWAPDGSQRHVLEYPLTLRP